jgi:hypothetical protein
MGTEAVHSHRFFVDGVPAGDASYERTFAWTPQSTGMHEVRVEIDDGIDRGTATLSVFVDP